MTDMSGQVSRTGQSPGGNVQLSLGHHRNYYVQYPAVFKAYMIVVMAFSIGWAINYRIMVVPAIQQHENHACQYNDSQLTYNAKMVFVYFAFFAVIRAVVFLPCMGRWVARSSSRSRRTYMFHLALRDGPLYLYAVASFLFWAHLLQSEHCGLPSRRFYQALHVHAMCSCVLSLVSMIFAYWHTKILVESSEVFVEEISRGAPEVLEKLVTGSYDERVFGDEEGKLYPAECAICLGFWEAHDVIKITPCGHAFHKECIENWLRTARTCALCRYDLAKARSRVQPMRMRDITSYRIPPVLEAASDSEVVSI